MSLRALIFDVDGTLAETEEAHRRAFNETFRQAGLDWHWPVEEYTRLLTTTGGKERIRRYRDELAVTFPTDEQIAALHERKTARYADILRDGDLKLRPGIRELIGAAREAGLKIAIATTTSRSNVTVLCEACWGICAEHVFDVIAAGDEVQAKKPAPDVYLLVLARLGLDADQAIAFEDSMAGLRAASAAGLRCAVTPSLYTRHEEFHGADWVCPDLSPSSLSGSLLKLLPINLEAQDRT